MSIELMNGEVLLEVFKQSTADLNKNKAMVDALNVFPVPDGDTGTNMSLTMNSALAEALKVENPTVENISKAISKGSLLGARGNSGVILSQIFRGFAKGCEGIDELDSVALVNAFIAAKEAAYKAVLKPVEGTILTVIRKMADFGEAFIIIDEEDEEAEYPSLKETMDALINVANETLDRTPEYLDVLKQAGVVDAGGRGLICILDGFHHVIGGNDAEDHNVEASPVTGHVPVQGKINPEDIKFAYCTEFIIRTSADNKESVKEEIQELGDSMVYVEDEDIIKVHIHTNNPGVALEKGLTLGELINIKIENMKEQHSSIIDEHAEMPAVPAEKKAYGFLAVAMGDGISNIFKDLGVDHIIEGGQTMNPSTEDIVQGINQINSDTVYILPNNSNIILAANQAKAISEKEIVVLPTKSIPQGVSAMIAFDGTADVDTNEEEMTEALQLPKTVQVTYSVRDTVFNDMEIKENDILGVADGTIASVGRNVHDVALEVLKNAMDEDSEIVTIYYGADIEEEAANELAEEIESLYEDVDVEVYYGGQPLYYYIFSVE